MKTVKVITNKGVFEAEVIQENHKTLIVKLPDGNHIKRKKSTQLVK